MDRTPTTSKAGGTYPHSSQSLHTRMSPRNHVHKQVVDSASRHLFHDTLDEESIGSTSTTHDHKRGHGSKQQLRWLIAYMRMRRYHVILLLACSAFLSLMYARPMQLPAASSRRVRSQQRPTPWPLPSVALKNLPQKIPIASESVTTPLDSASSSSASNSGWPRVSYFTELPSVDDPLWPPLPEDSLSSSSSSIKDHTTTTISTCVPGLAKDIYDENNISALLKSNQRQHVQAKELIFLLSDVNAVVGEESSTITGEQWCHDAYKVMQDFHSQLILVCVGERITAGRARHVLARIATSDVLAYIDTDDQEEPDRNQVIQRVFDCHPLLKLFYHSNYGTGHGLYGKIRYHPYDALVPETAAQQSQQPLEPITPSATSTTTSTTSRQCPDEQEGVEVIRGIALREMVDKSQDVLHFGVRTIGGIRPGHLVVKRDVIRYVRSSSINQGEDCLWARDIIYEYGRRDETAMFLNRPLTTYYQSRHSYNINVRTNQGWMNKLYGRNKS